jgi:hypothetical protein
MLGDDRHLTDDELVLLGDEEPSRRSRHVAACLPCQQRMRQLSLAESELKSWYREASPARPDRHVRARRALSARLQRAAAEHGRSWPVRLRDALAPGALWAAPLAAVLVFTLWSAGRLGDPSPALENTSVEAQALPVAAFTPGAVRDVWLDALCAGTPSVPAVPADIQRTVLSAYAMLDVPADQYELDYLVTPELGGATDPRNLWPQRYGDRRWNARVKDELEALLPRLVCSHQLDLASAQRDMAVDWIAAYKKYFRTSEPRRIYSVREQADEEELPLRGSANPPPPVLTLASLRFPPIGSGR